MLTYRMKRALSIAGSIILADAIFLAIVVLFFGTAIFPNAQKTVYTTATGECYHKSGCSSLSKSRYDTTVKEAVEDGYRRCSNCNPPKYNGDDFRFSDAHYSIAVPIFAVFACIGTVDAMSLSRGYYWYPVHLAVSELMSYGIDILF